MKIFPAQFVPMDAIEDSIFIGSRHSKLDHAMWNWWPRVQTSAAINQSISKITISLKEKFIVRIF